MDEEPIEAEPTHRRSRHPLRTAAKWAGIALLALVLLAAALLVGINTDPGRRFVTRQINSLEMASGLRIGIGELDGSLYGRLTIRRLTLGDTRGTFFTAPVVELDYRPFAYLGNHVDIRSLGLPQGRLMRLPELKASEADPNAPMLPDLDIDIGRLDIGRLQIDPAVTGQRHVLTMRGNVAIADGRAQVNADAATIAGAGLAGGDRLRLRVDAVPDGDRFDIEARLRAPAKGFVAGMAGLDKPIVAQIGGRGTWKRWQGRAQATLGGQALANLDVRAADGTIRVTGPLRPGLLMEGPVQRLTAPFVQLNLATTLQAERRADIDFKLNSSALAIAAKGRVDLGRSRFDGFQVAGRLLRPGAIAPNLSGRDVRVAVLIDGAFATPVVAYDLSAGAIGFNETIVQGLTARGRARIDADRIVVPISARAARITGLNAAVGGLLTNVAIDGSFAYSGGKILSDNLRIRSDWIDATAVVVADLVRGIYRAGLQGRVNNYLVEGIGLLDVTSNLDVVSEAGGFGIRGRVAVRTRRIDNESARNFLGGNAIISANIAMNANGVMSLDNLRMSSPQFRITSGSGSYAPNGRISFRAAGVSQAYGPVAVIVTGTATQPDVRLRAASPGFGIGLADVDARVRSIGRGYAIAATGRSAYGPFSADLVILSGGGPLTVEVRRVVFAGITFTGRIAQTRSGPFAGTLNLAGAGLSGTVRLSAAGTYQRADASISANGAQIPGVTPILIQRGIIQATAILYPQPSITADVQLAGLRSGNMLVTTARARVNYQSGRGQAQIVAEGSSGVPFKVAANVQFSPTIVRAALQGNVNRIAFRTVQPATISKVGADWQLAPVTIALPQGNVRLAGRYGNGMVLRSRLHGLDLSIFNAFSPGLGLGGTANGSIDFTQANGAAFPTADARLTISDFTRTGIATRSTPVNVAVVGRLVPQGGTLGAVIRRGGAVIGRAQVRLQPLSSGAGGWTTRLLASPLGGGIRYNGPAEVLWSLSGMADMQLSGPIALAADFSGRVQRPQLTGIVRANALRFEHETYGTRITNLALNGRFSNSTFELSQLSGRAGDGTISGQGRVGLSSASGFPIDIRLTLDRARLARSDDLGATVSGNIAVTNSAAQGALISGDLRLPEVRYQIVRQGAAEVSELSGVRRRGEPLVDPRKQTAEAAAAPSIWKLDLRVRADNQVFVQGMGLESEWETDLRIRGTSSSPVIVGNAEVIRGTFSFGGRRFELDSGEITFNGSQPIEPLIALSASTTVDNITATINVSGTAFNPQITFSSTPALPQDEILSRLLFGGSVTELSAIQAVQLAASLNSLRGSGGGGLNPLGKLRSASGLDRLRILGADQTTGRGTAIAAGVHISNDIYIEIITDARGFTATQLEVALSRALSVLSQVGSTGGTNVNVRYSKDY